MTRTRTALRELFTLVMVGVLAFGLVFPVITLMTLVKVDVAYAGPEKADVVSAFRGETVTGIVIGGDGFTGASNVTFGAGVNVTGFNVDSDTQITANITVDWDATLGGRNIGVTVGNSTTYLRDGLLIDIIDSEEIDPVELSEPFVMHLDGDYYAVAYRDTNDLGNLTTFTVAANGTISSVIDTYTFSKEAHHPSMTHVNGTIYAIAYSGASAPGHIHTDEAGWVSTVSINATGHISQPTGTAHCIEGLYHLNASSGTLVLDSTGNGWNGTTVNMEDGDWVVGKLNNCLDFDGANEYVDLADTFDYEYTDKFSVEFWMNTTASSGTMVSRKLAGGHERGWSIGIDTGEITVELQRLSTNRIQVDTSGQSLGDGAWHHIVFAYDGSSSASGVTIYVDGSDVSTSTVADTLSGSISNAATAQLAAKSNSDHFAGKLDEVVIYGCELTQACVTTRYNSGAGQEVSSSSTHFDSYRGTYPVISGVGGSSNYTIAYRGLTADVLSWSHLDSYSGSTAFVEAVGEADGTLMNMEDTDWVDGWGNLHNCLEFGGTDEYVNFGHREDLNFDRLDDYAVEFWMNTTSSAGSIIIGQEETTGDLPGWNIQGTDTGEVRSVLRNTSSNYITVTSTTGGILNNGMWWHIVINYDGSGNASGVDFYIDSVLDTNPTINSDTLTGSPKSTVASYQYSGRNGTNVLYTGLLDEPTVYNRPLTQAEVSARFNSGPGDENITATDINVATLHIDGEGACDGDIRDQKVWDFNGVENFVSVVRLPSSDYCGVLFQDDSNDGNLITVSSDPDTGDILQTLGDSVEYAPVGDYGEIISVNGSSDNYAIVYRDGAGDGQLQTRSMNATSGDIGNSSIDTMEWAENHVYPRIMHTSGSIYTIAAVDVTGGTDLGKAYTVNIDSDGTLDASALDSLTFEGTEMYGRPAIVNDTPNVQTVVYSGVGGDGWIKTLEGAAFEILAPQPTVTSSNPGSGARSEIVDPVLIGGTGFIDASNVSFGSGVIVNDFTVDSSIQISANITVAFDATLGNRSVNVTSPGGTGTGVDLFEVTSNYILSTITPSSGNRSAFVDDCALSGIGFTNVTSVDFGALITTSNLTIVDSGNLTVDLDIEWNATSGLRNVTMVNSLFGNTTKVDGFNVTSPLPTVTGCAPGSGNQSQVLDLAITGTNFADGVPSLGSGVTVNTYSVSNATHIAANISVSAVAPAGYRNVLVTTPGGVGNLTDGFEVMVAPTLASLSPDWGNRGEINKNVTMTGTGLNATISISFGSEITVNGFTIGNTTTVYANLTIPWDAVLGNYTVSMSVTGGYTPTIVDGFEVRAPVPTVTSIDPVDGDRLQTFPVQVYGTGLIDGNVTFGTNITVNSVVEVDETQLTANITILSGAALGARNVTTTTPGGANISIDAFTVYPAFELTVADPSSGNRSQTLNVNLIGTSFMSPNVTSVSFGSGITVNSFSLSNSTLIVANITVGASVASGARDITLVRSGSDNAVLTDGFTVNAGVPVVSACSPVSGNKGDVLDVVITGAGFTGATSVDFGTGVTVSGFDVDSDTQITATIEIASGTPEGYRDVTVTTPGGSDTLTSGFEVTEYSVASVLSNLGLMFLLLLLAFVLTYFAWQVKFLPISFAAGLTWFVLLVLLLVEPDVFNIGERTEWYYLLAFVFILMCFSVMLLQMRTDIRFEANVKGKKMSWFEYGKKPFMEDPEGTAAERQREYRKQVRGRFRR